MPNRKQTSNAPRTNLLREARAGLIPASDDIADEKQARTNRTARIILTAKSYLGSVARVSDELAIRDILADLRHYCDCTGLVFEKLDRAAYALYLEDTDRSA
jgi:hypothetical protein